MPQICITQQVTLSSLIMRQVVNVPVTAELYICSGSIEDRTSTGVEPLHGERGGERRERGGDIKQRSTFKLNQAEGMS